MRKRVSPKQPVSPAGATPIERLECRRLFAGNPMPDVIPVVRLTSANTWEPDERHTVTVDAVNIGAARVLGLAQVKLLLSADAVADASDTVLICSRIQLDAQPGDSNQISMSFGVAPDVRGGSFNVLATLNLPNAIQEASSANNTTAAFSKVTLNPPNVFFTGEFVDPSPPAIVAGIRKDIRVTLKNTGADVSLGQTVITLYSSTDNKWSDDDAPIASRNLYLKLKPGQSATAKVPVITTAPTGGQQFFYVTGTVQFAGSVGVNDSQAVSVDRTLDPMSAPWQSDSFLNAGLGFDEYSSHHDPLTVGGSDGVLLPAGQAITITRISGTVSAGAGRPLVDGEGDSSFTDNDENTGPRIPSRYTPLADHPLKVMGLLGAFADSNGTVIGEPFAIRNGRTVTIPDGAVRLQIGLNDYNFADNSGSFELRISIPGAGAFASDLPILFV